ncbi:hypothetical protein BV20DRAFT_1048603 [Pilatotrama ljubarskyi]|nr:hypothetical protein BV20DRAFT_1048603 [Pilatotrama ljubarskyi]
MSEHWRMEFNNYVQVNNLGPSVQWTQVQTGPRNAPTWTASVFLDGVEHGRGSATNLGAAREIAAEQALRALWNMRVR